MRGFTREFVLLGLVIAVFVISGLYSPAFFSLASVDTVWTDSAVLIALALTMMPIIMARGIDLSVAANMALTGMLVSLIGQANLNLPVPLLLLCGACIGGLLGLVNSALITGLELPPIVATLGTMSVFRGLIYVVSGGQWVSANEMPPALTAFPELRTLGLTSLEWLSILLIALAVLWHNSRRGREVRAYGGNPTAALYVGIPMRRLNVLLYSASGVVAGLSGVLWVSRYGIASTEVALGYELQVVAACVIGGVSIAGGIGSVFGTVLGSLFLITIYNALPIIIGQLLPSVQNATLWQNAIVGAAILIAAVVNQGAHTKGKHILREIPRDEASRAKH